MLSLHGEVKGCLGPAAALDSCRLKDKNLPGTIGVVQSEAVHYAHHSRGNSS
jgi:hypothetical protein